jgi:hypothetical protein
MKVLSLFRRQSTSTIGSAATLQNRHHLRWNAIAIRKIGPTLVILMTLSIFAPQLHPQTPTPVRTPLGVFAQISIEAL